MSSIASRWTALSPELRSVLRIVAALMFLQAGTMKLFGWPIPMPDGGTAPLWSVDALRRAADDTDNDSYGRGLRGTRG